MTFVFINEQLQETAMDFFFFLLGLGTIIVTLRIISTTFHAE